MITAEKMKNKANKYPSKIALAFDLWITNKWIKRAAKQGEFSINIPSIYPENIKFLEKQGFKIIKERNPLIDTPDYFWISWGDTEC